MMEARGHDDPAGGLVPFEGNRLSTPRLFAYLDAQSPPPFDGRARKAR